MIIWYIHTPQQKTTFDDPEALGILPPLYTGNCIWDQDLNLSKVYSVLRKFMSDSLPDHAIQPCQFLCKKNGSLYIYYSWKILLKATLKCIALLNLTKWKMSVLGLPHASLQVL